MTQTQVYITWGLLALILFAVRSVSISLSLAREEIEEFRQYMMGEKVDDISN